MKIAPAIRIGLTLVGIVLVAAAFFGVLGVGALANRPPLRVAVAVRDLAQGDRLEQADVRLVDQVIDPGLARLYVQEGDLPDFLGGYAVDVIRRGDPLNKVKIATGEDALNKRYALVLTGADDVVMVLPVNPDVIPSKIAAGDLVNIALFVGGDTNLQLPDATPTPAPQLFASAPAATPQALPMRPTEVPTAPPTPQLVMPVADLMLERVPVLDVAYEQVQNPAAASGQGDVPLYVNGPIRSIVVRVPRTHQVVLTFAAAASRLRYAVASPLDRAGADRPRGVVDWKRMVDLLRWKEQQAVMHGDTITQSLYPNYTPPAPPVVAPLVPATPVPQALPTAIAPKKP